MDEPLSNLDALLRMEMRAELKGILAESNTTTVYVTHDQVEAMSMADRIAIMQGGDIVQAATPVEVYRNPAAHFVGSFIGNPPMNFLLAKKISDGVWSVAGAELAGPTTKSDKLNFAIRPEDLTLSDTGPLQAKVTLVEPLGSHVLASCNIENSLFRVVLDSDTTVSRGDVLNLQPMQDRIRWFDLDTELAV